MISTRRSLLLGLGAVLAAPAVVRAEALMPIKVWTPPPVLTMAQIETELRARLDERLRPVRVPILSPWCDPAQDHLRPTPMPMPYFFETPDLRDKVIEVEATPVGDEALVSVKSWAAIPFYPALTFGVVLGSGGNLGPVAASIAETIRVNNMCPSTRLLLGK